MKYLLTVALILVASLASAGTIQVKTGTDATLPATFKMGEPAFTRDTHRAFLGYSTGKVELLTVDKIGTTSGTVAAGDHGHTAAAVGAATAAQGAKADSALQPDDYFAAVSDHGTLAATIAFAKSNGELDIYIDQDVTLSGHVTIDFPCKVYGDGDGITTVSSTSTTDDIFLVTSSNVQIYDMRIQRSGAGASTAGAAINASSAGNKLNNTSFHDLTITGTYDGIVRLSNVGSKVENNWITNVVRYGVYDKAEVAYGDNGDNTLDNNFFWCNTGAAAAYRFEGGGGPRITRNKILDNFQYGIDFQLADGIETSVAVIANNSIEQQTAQHIRLGRLGTTGVMSLIQITGNHFAAATALSTHKGLEIGAGISDVTITGGTAGGQNADTFCSVADSSGFAASGVNMKWYGTGYSIAASATNGMIGVNNYNGVATPVSNSSTSFKITEGAISDVAYDATSWDGNNDAPTKNAVRDKIETILATEGTGNVTGPVSSVDSHIAQFSGTNGQTLKDGPAVVTSVGSPGSDTNIPTEKAVRTAIGAGGSMVYPAAGIPVSTGIAWDTSKTAPSGALVGDTDTQTLSGKTMVNGSVITATAVPVLVSATATSGGTLSANTTYCYTVTAIMGYSTESTKSNEVCATTTTTNKTIGLAWNAVTGAVRYRPYRTTTSGDYSAAYTPTAGTTNTTINDTGSIFVMAAAAPSVQHPAVSFNNGALGIGITPTSAPFQMVNGYAGSAVLIDTFGVSASTSGTIGSRAARGTQTSPAAVQSGDQLGCINWRGYAATGWAGGGRTAVCAYAEENYTDVAQGSYLDLETTTVGGTSRTTKLRVTGSGSVGIGTTAPEAAVDINSATGNNLQLTYNDNNGSAANKVNFAVSSSGDLTVTPSGGDVSVAGNLTTTGDLTAHAIPSPGAIGGTTPAAITGTTVTATGVATAKSFTEGTNTASGTAFTLDIANGSIQRLNTTGNTTVTVTALTAGKSMTLNVCYGGVHTLAFTGATVKWPNGIVPTATSISGKCDKYVFDHDGTDMMGGDGGRNYATP